MNLRLILFIAFSCVAVIPVVSLAVWIYVFAIDKEVDRVRESHLLLAENVGAALDRYAFDVQSVFEHVASQAAKGISMVGTKDLMANLGFVYLCIANTKSGEVVNEVVPEALPCPKAVPNQRLQTFLDLARPDKIVFSPVMADLNQNPAIYLLQLSGDTIIIGAVSTNYIVAQGKAVAFGQRGHAAIVDSTGRLIAHPLPAWRKSMKDISKLAPVQKMLARETGTIKFFSPALKADMVAGYTFVPTTGWGVMIPQPFVELHEQAGLVRLWATAISGAGILAAGLLSWFLAGYLARPLSQVIGASQRMSHGDLEVRVDVDPGFKPTEMEELQSAFNTMARDVSQAMTERKKANEALLSSLEETALAKRAMSEFLANMSHELRTPLNAIIGFSDILQSQMFGPVGKAKYLEYAQDINASGKHLLGVISEILDLSKIQAGKTDLHEENINVPDALGSCLTVVKERASKADLTITFDVAPDLPELRADKLKFKQIVLNILSNAIKFTPAGGEITVKAWHRVDDGISVQVSDTGIGIAPEDIPKALAPFQQLESNLYRRTMGTGLGLSLTKTLAELHGGSLDLQSAVGVGTTVTVRFPAERVVLEIGNY
ncbi:MAG: HAMP domain-containing protein [Rhodospirillaceae bacterium]|nr:HAMP domain-containing protein [Rhodospirillaceae bacterium]MBT6139203.1 HAMP domain-containing protein [Rhodospirillaceae bacterium]